MLRTWPRTSSSTLTPLRMASSMPRTKCLSMPWTLQWVLHSKLKTHHSLWVPILSSLSSTTNRCLSLWSMTTLSRRAQWLRTRHPILSQPTWSQKTRETRRTRRQGWGGDQLPTRLVKDWGHQTSSIRPWHRLCRAKTTSCSLLLTSESFSCSQWTKLQCTLQLKWNMSSLRPLRSKWTRTNLNQRISRPRCKLHSWSHQPKCQISLHLTLTWHQASMAKESSWLHKWILMLTRTAAWACKDMHLLALTRSQKPTSVSSKKCSKWTRACHSITSITSSLSLNLILPINRSQVRLKDRDSHLRTNTQPT